MEAQQMSSKIFVGSIPYFATGYDLREFFSKFGQVVDALVVRDKRTRKSKGFGFVKFSDEEAAKRALEAKRDELGMKKRVLNTGRAQAKKPRDLFGNIKVEGALKLAPLNRKTEPLNDQSNLDTTPDDNDEDSFETKLIDLNDDAKEMIFSQLSLIDLCRMSGVCKQWNLMMISAWSQKKKLDFTHFGLTLSDKILFRILAKTKKGLTSLTLGPQKGLSTRDESYFTNSSSLSYFVLEMVGELCPDLKRLDISGIVVTKPGLKKFSKFCPNVEVVTAKNCIRFNAKSAWELLHSQHKLQSLDLSKNERLTGKCFLRAPATITRLVLTACKSLLSVGVALAIEYCPALTHLSLGGCTSLDDTVVSSLLLSKLTNLTMSSRYPKMTSSANFAKLGNIQTLKSLDVSFNDKVSDDLLANLSSVKDLDSLFVSGCNGQVFYNDNGIFTRRNDGVTDVGLRKLKNIAHLGISYLSGVSERGLRHLSTLKALKTLILRGAPDVTNNGLGELVCLPSLTRLDLSGCRGVKSFLLGSFLFQRSPDVAPLDLVVGGTDGGWMVDEQIKSQVQSFSVGNGVIHLDNYCIDKLRPDYRDYYDDDGWSHSSYEDNEDGEEINLPMEIDDENGVSDNENDAEHPFQPDVNWEETGANVENEQAKETEDDVKSVKNEMDSKEGEDCEGSWNNGTAGTEEVYEDLENIQSSQVEENKNNDLQNVEIASVPEEN